MPADEGARAAVHVVRGVGHDRGAGAGGGPRGPRPRSRMSVGPGGAGGVGGRGGVVVGLAALASGVVRALGVLAELRPSLVVGVGGYASVAVVVAAATRRIPTVLLEQNVVPGAANRWLARFARCVCVGF